MSCTGLWALHLLTSRALNKNLILDSIFGFNLQMGELSNREVNQLAQSHRAGMWPNQDLNLSQMTLKPDLMACSISIFSSGRKLCILVKSKHPCSILKYSFLIVLTVSFYFGAHYLSTCLLDDSFPLHTSGRARCCLSGEVDEAWLIELCKQLSAAGHSRSQHHVLLHLALDREPPQVSLVDLPSRGLLSG